MDLQNFRIDLEPPLIRSVEAVFRARGLSRREGTKRVLEWFVAAEDVIQQSVLRQLPESIEADIARLTLERLAEGRPRRSIAAKKVRSDAVKGLRAKSAGPKQP